jgi:hypothetical protein
MFRKHNIGYGGGGGKLAVHVAAGMSKLAKTLRLTPKELGERVEKAGSLLL